MRRAVGLLLLALAAAPRLAAQGTVAALIGAARAQFDDFNTDSASVLLARALAQGSGATSAERVRAYVLYGIAQLSARNPTAARQAFRSALQLNPAERVDSLVFLEPDDLAQVFNAERAAVAVPAGPPPLAVDVAVPYDTVLLAPAGRLQVATRPTFRSRVMVAVARADTPATPVWSNTEMVDSVGAAVWDLRARDGLLVPTGRYALRVTAADSLGRTAIPVERVLAVTNPNARGDEAAWLRVQLEENLAFTAEPARATTAGRGFRVVVTARDAHGRTEKRFHDTVTVAIAAGTGRIGAHLSGNASVAADTGVAVFTGLSLDSVGTDYGLTATAANMASASTVSFDVTPGAASRLAVAVEPATVKTGAAFRAVVTALDAPGNVATLFGDTVTVQITAGTGRGGARLSGTTRVAAVSGVAVFTGLGVDSGGAGYTVTAGAAAMAPASSASFNVVSAAWPGWRFLAAGAGHECGLSGDGIAYCWGANDHGELGGDSMARRPAPVVVAGGLAFTALTAGQGHSCALTGDGAAWCWGQDSVGELGDGAHVDRRGPQAVAGGLRFTSLAAGSRHTCGLTGDGAAYCWGANAHGELGDGSTVSRDSPVAVAGSARFASLVAGDSHTCGLTKAGAAYCWGWNYFGQLGDSSTRTSDTPVRVQGGLRFAALAASGSNHTCGRSRGGAAYCWGDNSFGQVGDGSSQDRTTPVTVGGPPLTSLTTGDWHTCGLTEGGIAHCWGDNGYGELGDASTSSSASPVTVTGGLKLASLVAGYHHTCGVTTAGIAYCWGENLHGELADGSTKNRNTPVAVAKP